MDQMQANHDHILTTTTTKSTTTTRVTFLKDFLTALHFQVIQLINEDVLKSSAHQITGLMLKLKIIML